MALEVSKRQYVWAAVAGVVLTIAAVLLLPSTADAKDPEDELQCSSDKRVVTIADYDENVPETETPEEIATEWKDGTQNNRPIPLGDKTVFKLSDTKHKIGYKDRNGAMAAVIVFDKGDKGWRVERIVECA